MLFGFNMAGGHREENLIISISLRKITIGRLKGETSNEELIKKIFDETRMKIMYESNVEDCLLCHVAFAVPIIFACYYCDEKLKKIRNNKAYLNRIIDAYIEGFRTIEA